MARLITLIAGLFALSLVSFGAAGQSTSPPAPPEAGGEGDASALAKKLQNPIGDLYSFPFQNNTNFNTGPNKGTQDILNVQPVIPIHINEDWNVITRTILPLVWQPSFQPAQTVPFGTGPTTFSAFLSPANPVNGWLWGVGPVVQVPTISSATLDYIDHIRHCHNESGELEHGGARTARAREGPLAAAHSGFGFVSTFLRTPCRRHQEQWDGRSPEDGPPWS
jgi:hypothetical protein